MFRQHKYCKLLNKVSFCIGAETLEYTESLQASQLSSQSSPEEETPCSNEHLAEKMGETKWGFVRITSSNSCPSSPPQKSQTNKGGILYSLFKQNDIKKKESLLLSLESLGILNRLPAACTENEREKMRQSGRGSYKEGLERDAERQMVEDRGKRWRETGEKGVRKRGDGGQRGRHVDNKEEGKERHMRGKAMMKMFPG